MNENEYININKVAEAKGLKSNRSLRLEINKPESKYVAREVKVNGGTSYEILYSSLEPEIQQKLQEGNTKSTALVPLNYYYLRKAFKKHLYICRNKKVVKYINNKLYSNSDNCLYGSNDALQKILVKELSKND